MIMFKGLIITHGNLGHELLNVARTIIDKKINLECIDFTWKEDGTHAINKIEHFIRVNKEHNIIIFTDMFGGSPTNICLGLANRKNIEIITGVNLPGLLKFITYQDKKIDLNKMSSLIKKEAIEGINLMSEYLGEKGK
jgi:PTS system mannose-specific IIA component